MPLLLAACAQTAPAAPTPTGAGQVSARTSAVFPTYQPAANRPTPDFPSAGSLYEDGYNNYPANPVRSVSRTPGTGSSGVTAFVQPLQAPPTPLAQNPAWQEVNRQLGTQYRDAGAFLAATNVPPASASLTETRDGFLAEIAERYFRVRQP